jgi:hypothetical protein
MSDYLWDKSGPPDPEIERLERLLEPFRYRPSPQPRAIPIQRRPRYFAYAAAGACAAAVLLAAILLRSHSDAWSVSLEGSRHSATRLRAGQTLHTAPGEIAHLSLEHVGRLDVDPETTLRMVSSRSDQQRFELVNGTIHAHIGAPPRVFVVNTPSAIATDLGCSYTLHVDPSGDGMLRVNSGLIEFDWNTRRALVPTGAIAVTKAGTGPGTPFFEDAAPEFRRALASYDFAHNEPALPRVLTSARPRDAMTLLNLVQTVSPADRPAVLARLVAISAPPAGVDLAAITAGRFETLQPWWNTVGLRHHPSIRLF